MSNVKANTEKPKRDKYTWLGLGITLMLTLALNLTLIALIALIALTIIFRGGGLTGKNHNFLQTLYIALFAIIFAILSLYLVYCHVLVAYILPKHSSFCICSEYFDPSCFERNLQINIYDFFFPVASLINFSQSLD